MGIPLWRRIIDIVAWVACAFAAVGFTVNAALDHQSTSERLWSAVIAAVLVAMLWRAAPVVLRRQA